jgi:hypothetical protein
MLLDVGEYRDGVQAGRLAFCSWYSQETGSKSIQPPIQRLPEVKWPGHETGHLAPSSDVKNSGATPPLPLTSS